MEKPPTDINSVKTPDTPQNARVGRSYRPLTNKHYYDKIEYAMQKLAAPTVGDAIEAMLKQGNKDYFLAFPHLNRKHMVPSENTPKFTLEEIPHELGHLCTRTGHTPQMEHTGLGFSIGLSTSAHALSHSEEEVERFLKVRRSHVVHYIHQGRAYQPELPVEASKTVWAVQFAAGLYMREKLDAFAKAGLLEAPQDYAKQKAFSEAYRAGDSDPTQTPKCEYDWNAFTKAPYDMIKLSKAEWQAIKGVALGMREPDQTPYPKRMEAIKQALVATDLFFDRPKFAEQVQAEKIAKQQNAKIGKSYPAPPR